MVAGCHGADSTGFDAGAFCGGIVFTGLGVSAGGADTGRGAFTSGCTGVTISSGWTDTADSETRSSKGASSLEGAASLEVADATDAKVLPSTADSRREISWYTGGSCFFKIFYFFHVSK